MKRFVGMLMLVAFALSIAVVARAAPTKQKAFAPNAVAEVVLPVVVTAPVMTGYDVIENISTGSRGLSIAQDTFESRYVGAARLSPTRAWHSIQRAASSGTARSSPIISLKR